jgi:hypothetical protein
MAECSTANKVLRRRKNSLAGLITGRRPIAAQNRLRLGSDHPVSLCPSPPLFLQSRNFADESIGFCIGKLGKEITMPLASALEAFFAFMETQIIGSPVVFVVILALVFFAWVKCMHCFPQ